MTSHDILDFIADSYIPFLASIAVFYQLQAIQSKQWKRLQLGLASLIAMVAMAYGMMVIDQKIGLWPTLGLDYSTHSAVGLALVLWLTLYARSFSALWTITLLLYYGLIWYLGYHGPADIISTAIAIYILCWPIYHYAKLPGKKRKA